MKGGELHSTFMTDDRGGQSEQEQHQSTTVLTTAISGSAKNEPSTLVPCSLSAPSTSSGSISIARSTTAPLSQGKKYIDVQLLTREHLYLSVDVKCKIGEVYRYVCAHVGLQCVNLFGLACYVENEYRFCDHDDRLSKFAPKNWQKAPGWGTDLVGNPSVILYLRVHTFVDYIRLINCPVSLLHYYLQLRENVRIQWEPSWVPEERCFEAAALALQSDYGDYRPDKHTTGYFRADAYFPVWVINGRGLDYVLRHLPSMHHDLEGLEPYEARIRYCREASRAPCPVNMHLYRLRRNKTDAQDTIYLGVTARGLELFEQKPSGDRQHLMSFVWSKIGKLAFDRKKFTLASLDGQKMVFYTSSDEKSRYLLTFCRAVHQNIIRLQPVISEARKRETEERKQFRESYIYSDTADLDWIRKTDGQTPAPGFYEYNLLPTSTTNFSLNSFPRLTSPISGGNGSAVCGGGGQRVSLVSDASSNTTSGIVSDRQHTHDDSENENEGDGDFEITTGCNSSPLVSELSLATSGASPPFCASGGQPSQQSSPVAEFGFMDRSNNEQDDRKRLGNFRASNGSVDAKRSADHFDCGMGGDDEEGDGGEGGSSVGPCSDRTVTAAADDTQSTETTSTTGKLEDLCTESDLPGAPAANSFPAEEKVRHWPAEDLQPKRPPFPTVPNNGIVSIAELRRQTLHDYADRHPLFHRRASPPVLPLPSPMPSASNLEDPSAEAQAVHSISQQDGQAAMVLKSLSTEPSSVMPALKSVENPIERAEIMNFSREHVGMVQNGIVPPNQQGMAQRPKSYRIVSSLSSNEGFQNGEAVGLRENRSTPSPPHLETVMVEPPPPPPYLFDVDAALDSKIAQSYSLSNLPSSSSSIGRNGSTSVNDCFQQPPLRRVQRPTADGLPNYEQALQYKVELGRRMATSTNLEQSPAANVPWLHTSTARRWPTVSGIHPAVLDQLVNAIGARKLQQAQSEPGLAGPYYAADDYVLNRRCCHEMGRFAGPYGSPMACTPYAATDSLFDGGVAGAYRSISTHQLSGGTGRACACQYQCGLAPPPMPHHPHTHFQSSYAQYGGNHQPALACTPSGLYVKQPRARLTAPSSGHRLHMADCQQSASQLLYSGNGPNHGSGGSKAVARVHSMYEAAKADHVRRSLEYEYYRRFEQQVVQNTRRELRKQQLLERQLAASIGDTSGLAEPSPSQQENGVSPAGNEEASISTNRAEKDDLHSAPGHYCESCQETHTAGKIDLAQLKDIIRAQNVDLPLMRALCNDHSVNQQQATPSAPETSATVNDSAAHPLLRQKKHSPTRRHSKQPPAEVAPFEYLPSSNGRPMTWHESFYEMQTVGSSSWPPYEFSYDH